MLHCILISLTAESSYPIMGALGCPAQAWFLRQLTRSHAALASKLHNEQGLKPYTISTLLDERARPLRAGSWLEPGQACFIRLTSLNEELSEAFEKKINRRKDGTYYTEEQSITPVRNPEGEITHFVGIKLDVSHRKNAEEELRQKNRELTLAYDAAIEGWSRAMDLRDKETEDHTMRVTTLTLNLARHMNIPENELIDIKRGALLHDIGKLGVLDNILLKPGKLTDEEWEVMRRHPALACEMLANLEFLKPALDIPYCHHEKWDGSGYPRGLKGEEIPLAARIFAVADVWDALTSDRPYRSAWTKSQTLEYIEQESGKHFDPRVIEVFLPSVEALIP